jgi:chaperonin GroEL
MSREYDDNQTLQQKIMTGANKLADNVASTLGPRGRNVLLQEKGKPPFITKDGVTVAAFVSCEDPFENAAAQIIKQAAVETNNNAGDGTTTATVLARAILRESQKYIVSGISPIELKRGIDASIKQVCDHLDGMARPVTSAEDIAHIATISANNDSNIGNLITMAIDRVGEDGSVTIEESRSIDTSIDVTEGFRFNAGYCATAFINDERRAMMSHEEPLFLITDHKISQVEPILPILEMIAREGRPLVIVAEDIEGQALAAMIMNAVRGTLKIAAIKAPLYGEERRNLLDDLALSVGAEFIKREDGVKLAEVKLSDLGTARAIESTKNGTTIIGGKCNFKLVDQRIESLKNQIKDTSSFPDCEVLQSRVVRLSSGVAIISVGGTTEVEMIERKHRIEDALEAVRSAQDDGIIGGGGTALIRACDGVKIETTHEDQIHGLSIIKEACKEPFRQMALNAGESPDILIKLISESDTGVGWDFRNNKLTNMHDGGIIDPVKVTKTALQNAASCASTLITTNFGIIQTEFDDA